MGTVGDVMSEPAVAVGESTSFKLVVQLMDRHRPSALPVIDEAGRPVGMVSEADVLLKEGFGPGQPRVHFERWRHRVERAKAGGVDAREIMTSPVATVGPDTPIADAARLMYEQVVVRIPVVDAAGKLIGVVSWRDLLRSFLRTDEAIRREILEDVIGKTLCLSPHAVVVTVRDGVVTLTGQVERESLIEVLVGLVHRVDGVVKVNQRLSYPHDAAEDSAFTASVSKAAAERGAEH